MCVKFAFATLINEKIYRCSSMMLFRLVSRSGPEVLVKWVGKTLTNSVKDDLKLQNRGRTGRLKSFGTSNSRRVVEDRFGLGISELLSFLIQTSLEVLPILASVVAQSSG